MAIGECSGFSLHLTNRGFGLGQDGFELGRCLSKVEGFPDKLVAKLGRILVASATNRRANRQHPGTERFEHRDGQALVITDARDKVPPAQDRPVLVARLAAVQYRAVAW